MIDLYSAGTLSQKAFVKPLSSVDAVVDELGAEQHLLRRLPLGHHRLPELAFLGDARAEQLAHRLDLVDLLLGFRLASCI